MVSTVLAQPACVGERFVTEVYSELSIETIQKRWTHVNVLLRLSMLAGLPMQFEAALTLLCDLAAEMVEYDKAIVFWDEGQEHMQLRRWRGFAETPPVEGDSNLLNLWAARYGRPLRVARGQHAPVDALLDIAGSASVLTLPLFVSNRVRGSLQLFSASPDGFTQEDAQLLWLLALIAENLLIRESSSEDLVRFAFTDYLTGLRTRGYFEQQLDLEFKRAERRRQKFALLMVDIDHFKELNDSLGHHAGDQVLRDVASILVKDMREVDTVARYGGEEFVIVLPETTQLGAMYVAERLRHAVEQAKFLTGSPRSLRRLTISIGVSVYESDARFKRELIEASDAALYAAKREGRNRVVCFSDLTRREKKKVS
ncbi:MAG TPA: sensor domain-containing diguanylate cyclase [Candidatus Angelobacter sp.]|nr:sensor domain-containing diguanylate cyclase [Candidatus Angelobacter sp.]